MIDRIITLDDLVVRDGQESVQAWILWKCTEAVNAKKIQQGWDGETVEGEPVLAFVNNGRWLARCKVCGNPIYVSPVTPVLYCPECGNGDSTIAWAVEFPEEREQIEAALLRRPIEVANGKVVRNEVEWMLHSRPSTPSLARAWRPGITVEALEQENNEAFEKQRGGRR